MDIKITLTDSEYAAMEYTCADPVEFLQNYANTRVVLAFEKISKIALEKSIELGIQLPSNRDDIIAMAYSEGWITKSADSSNSIIEV
jgi:hypothetical protein